VSYNIDSVETPVLDAWMTARDIVALHDEHARNLPEDCFLYDLLKAAKKSLLAGAPETPVRLVGLAWRCEGSGRSVEILEKKIAPCIHGRVDAIFTWECGDSFSGLRIVDGLVTKCDVSMTLIPKQEARR